MTDVITRLTAIVRRIAKSDTDPDPDESLFDAGYLDSFALTDMVTAIENEFQISIPDSDLNPRRFDTLNRIADYLATKM
jgi:D-alanine--poly(phosphoribitol) ligase subunit 2